MIPLNTLGSRNSAAARMRSRTASSRSSRVGSMAAMIALSCAECNCEPSFGSTTRYGRFVGALHASDEVLKGKEHEIRKSRL